MNKLGAFIQAQMDVRGWRQIDLVRASGLTRQRISRLLSDRELHGMLGPKTVAGLAEAFGMEPVEIDRVAATAAGRPVDQDLPIIRTAADEPSERLLEILLTRERQKKSRHHVSNGLTNSTSGVDPSEQPAAPNHGIAANDAGQVSGEIAGTSGDLRDPRRSHGSDTPPYGYQSEHAHP